MSRKSEAQELVRAAGGRTGTVSPGVAVLLEAVAVLKAADGGHVAPDPAFATSLRQKLIEEHDSAVEAPAKVETGGVRRLLPAFAIGAAALAAVAIALVLFFVVKPAGPTVARLRVDVGAVQVTSGGKTRPVTASTDEKNGEVKAGDTIATYSGSRATLSFLNKDVTRLEAASTMKVDSYDSGDVGLVLVSGKAYCRVVRHGDFTVSCSNGVEVTATGTAFGVNARDGVIDSAVFEGSVKVTWPTGSYELNQGKHLTVTKMNNRYLPVVTEVDAAADLSWLAFNRDLDRGLKLPLGLLETLGATPPGGNPPPGNAPQVPGASSPGSSTPADNGIQSSPGPASSSPASTNPIPGPQPGPEPGPEPTPGPGPQVTPSVSLRIASAGPPVVVNWSIQNGGSVTGVAVLKGVGVMDPSYPDHSIAVTSPANNSMMDKDVESGGTYSYRVALLSNGAVVALSNRQTVSVPPPQLSLDGKGHGTSVYLIWSLTGVVHIDSWAVLRSGNNSSPSFPADMYETVPYIGPGGSFTDSKATPNRCYYRMVGLNQGRPVVRSSTVYLP